MVDLTDLDKVKVKHKVKNIVVPGLEWMSKIKEAVNEQQKRQATDILSSLIIFTSNHPDNFGIYDYIGIITWMSGLFIEVVADKQKSDFKNDINDVKVQFHHLIKTIPKKSVIVFNQDDENIRSVLKMGHWSQLDSFTSKKEGKWSISISSKNFCNITKNSKLVSKFQLKQFGEHNATNALAAIVAAYKLGIPVEQSSNAL